MTSNESSTVNDDHIAGREFEFVIVGAGFSGLYMLYRLRQQGRSVRLVEAGDAVGGTWYWNRYPGARCDVQSWDYSYSFDHALEQEWVWSERYPSQPEIQRYLDHVADRFELKQDITFGARVTELTWHDDDALWSIEVNGDVTFTAKNVVAAVGCLSTPRTPEFPGLFEFQGDVYHTGDWPREPVDFTGKRVAVIGTGSSGVQLIPAIADDVEYLCVLQRTPNFSIPAHNGPLLEDHLREIKLTYPERRERARQTYFGVDIEMGPKNLMSALELSPEERDEVYEERWRTGGTAFLLSFIDMLTDTDANETAADFVRRKIRSIVADPDTAERLSPTSYPLGGKRICVDTNYYATFNRDNVELIDVGITPIDGFTATSIVVDGRAIDVDCVVLATGYDAMTGSLLRLNVTGRDGLSLDEAWSAGPQTYLGLGVAGFPNLFIIAGPGSPSVLTNMPASIEQHVNWLADLFSFAHEQGIDRVEVVEQAQDEWVTHVNEVAAMTMFLRANSWYLGANVPGKPRVFMPYAGGLAPYGALLDGVAAEHAYQGFQLEHGDVTNGKGVQH